MARLTLHPKRWYACLLMGDEFGSDTCNQSPSPIRVDQIKPLGTGQGTFELDFFHANYPDGVQYKTYALQTIHRGDHVLLARSTSHEPPRFLYITEITIEWLNHYFPNIKLDRGSVQDQLNRLYGTGP